MYSDSHLHGHVIDVPKSPFLERLEAPHRSPHLADFIGRQILFARRRLDRLVKPCAVEVFQILGICTGTQTHTRFAVERANFSIERIAKSFIYGNMLEHVADIVEHRFAQTRICLKIFTGDNVCDVATERRSRCHSRLCFPRYSTLRLPKGAYARILHLRTNFRRTAFFPAVFKGASAQFLRDLSVIHKVTVMVERHRKSVWSIFGQQFVKFSKIRRLHAHQF